MTALTGTPAPTSAFAGYPGSCVRGRMSSITMRPVTRTTIRVGVRRRAGPPPAGRYRVSPMRALRSFTVRARLPEPLEPLQELAFNLRWAWDERTRDLFRWVDPQIWEQTFHDPVRLLSLVDQRRLEQLIDDPAFMGVLGEMHEELGRYTTAPRWFQRRSASALRAVAYFSPEFGLAEGLPLVGVGLMYRMGYFRQHLNSDGWQEERYPLLDPHAMALRLVEGATVDVTLAGERLTAQIWLARVGRVPLYLLDADVEANSDDLRAVTDRLYGGGTEHRIRQEILLGIGGVRALTAVGADTQVFHTNEGHAGFLGLERIRLLMTREGLSWAEAIEAVRAGTIFTTHTPVAAGIDRFGRDLMERYFRGWADECGVSFDDLMALGHFPDDPADAPFNMAVKGLRLAGISNGVSRLHGDTSRRMFQPLWPAVPAEEVPITSVTNGVHGRTWVSPEMDDLLSRYISPAWDEARANEWARIDDARDDELWRVREQTREALVRFVRQRLHRSRLAAGASPTDVEWTDEVLDPRNIIVGFARRFAAYKRATLLLSQPDRLRALLLDESRPLQLVFAGKAHPADELGKEMIRRIAAFSADPAVRHRIVFVEDYDISVARTLYQGSDVWLNTPRRPMEASGTSGQKAALNGALNCSISDGWWDEMANGDNGWTILSADYHEDVARRDEVEAESLFEILERQVIPLYYERSGGRFPREWVRRMKVSLRTLGPQVLASRMVRDYVEDIYEPLAARTEHLRQGGYGTARSLTAWKAEVAEAWPAVKVVGVDGDTGMAPVDLGGTRVVTAEVTLGRLRPEDVTVQLLHGAVAVGDELTATEVVEMSLVGPPDDESHLQYRGEFTCDRAGRHGYTVRVIPRHADLMAPLELNCVAWA